MIVAAFISDRPADLYLDRCVKSLDDQPDAAHIGLRHVVDDRDHRLGMAGAVNAAWEWALGIDSALGRCEYLLHVEEDFEVFDLPLAQMRYVLDRNPHLASVVLKREPWSQLEHQAGGQMEVNPTAHTQHGAFGRNVHWVEHDLLFSLNPCLIPRKTLELGPPPSNARGFEAEFADVCRANGLRFAYYGKLDDKPRCRHIGAHRAGNGWRW